MLRLPRLIGPLCIAVLCSMSAATRADEAAEVSKLYREGKSAEAFTRADRYLETKPNDAAVRFVRGVMLMDTKRTDEAMAVFTSLTEDFPNLSEPYNNLGVLLSSQGRYGEARTALEAAVRNNPSFATAQENLGDVYAALAAEAYGKAAALDPANGGPKPKLALIRQLLARPAS